MVNKITSRLTAFFVAVILAAAGVVGFGSIPEVRAGLGLRGSAVFVPDQTPDQIAFAPVSNITPGATATGTPVTISGVNLPTPFTTENGLFLQINGTGGFVSSGNVGNGDTVTPRMIAATANNVTVTGSATFGGAMTATFSVTSAPAGDSSPDAFSLPAVTAAPLNTPTTGSPVLITGINIPASFTTTGGLTIQVGGSGGFASTGTVANNQTITPRLTSSSSYATTVSGTVNVGGQIATFNVTTAADAGGGEADPPGTVDLAAAGMKSVKTTGSITSGSNLLTVADASQLNVGDWVIVATGNTWVTVAPKSGGNTGNCWIKEANWTLQHQPSVNMSHFPGWGDYSNWTAPVDGAVYTIRFTNSTTFEVRNPADSVIATYTLPATGKGNYRSFVQAPGNVEGYLIAGSTPCVAGDGFDLTVHRTGEAHGGRRGMTGVGGLFPQQGFATTAAMHPMGPYEMARLTSNGNRIYKGWNFDDIQTVQGSNQVTFPSWIGNNGDQVRIFKNENGCLYAYPVPNCEEVVPPGTTFIGGQGTNVRTLSNVANSTGTFAGWANAPYIDGGYLSNAIPRALLAKISAKSTNVLTLVDRYTNDPINAQETATNAEVYFDNVQITTQAGGLEDVNAQAGNTKHWKLPCGLDIAMSRGLNIAYAGYNGTQIYGCGKENTRLVRPTGTSSTLGVVFEAAPILRDFSMKGNHGRYGYGIDYQFSRRYMPHNPVAPTASDLNDFGQGWPMGFVINKAGGVVVKNMNTYDVFMHAMAFQYAINSTAENVTHYVNYAPEHYMQWWFPSANGYRNLYKNVNVVSDKLTSCGESFQDEDTIFDGGDWQNCLTSVNSAGGTIWRNMKTIVDENAILGSTFGIQWNQLWQTNNNVDNQQSTNFPITVNAGTPGSIDGLQCSREQGDRMLFTVVSGTAPTGLTNGNIYWLVNETELGACPGTNSTFQLSTTNPALGSFTPIALGSGSGTYTMRLDQSRKAQLALTYENAHVEVLGRINFYGACQYPDCNTPSYNVNLRAMTMPLNNTSNFTKFVGTHPNGTGSPYTKGTNPKGYWKQIPWDGTGGELSHAILRVEGVEVSIDGVRFVGGGNGSWVTQINGCYAGCTIKNSVYESLKDSYGVIPGQWSIGTGNSNNATWTATYTPNDG